MDAQEKAALLAGVQFPEVRSCLAQLLEEVGGDRDKSCRLTILALLSFYRKTLGNDFAVETDNNILKSRLVASGVLWFGPLFSARPRPEVSKAKRLHTLEQIGFCSEHLVFLNPTQVELFFTYTSEIGLTRMAA